MLPVWSAFSSSIECLTVCSRCKYSIYRYLVVVEQTDKLLQHLSPEEAASHITLSCDSSCFVCRVIKCLLRCVVSLLFVCRLRVCDFFAACKRLTAKTV